MSRRCRRCWNAAQKPCHDRGVGRRRSERFQLALEAVVRIGAEPTPLPAQLRDLSAGGALVVVSAPIHFGAAARLRFNREDGVPCEALGRVLRSTRVGDGLGFAIEFAHVNQALTHLLGELAALGTAAPLPALGPATIEVSGGT